MNRYSRRRDPVVPRVQRVELSENHLTLRLLGVGVAIAVAVAAFGYFLNGLLPNQAGWRQIEVTNSETGCQTQFILNYDVGSGSVGATQEYKQISALYTLTTDAVYQALSTETIDHVNNLAQLNDNPNTAVTVDPILYDALQTLEENSSRAVFFGPLYAYYNSLYACAYDHEAESFDPYFDAEAGEYVKELAAFASSEEHVSVSLGLDNQVTLHVSDEYLAFAKENEVDAILDFGWYRNAFLIDAAADALIAEGFTHGTISSFDGFTRTLGAGDYSVNLFENRNGSAFQRAVLTTSVPVAQIAFRSFPVLEMDRQNYYAYADGTVRGPYLSGDGLMRSGADTLLVFSEQLGCAPMALQICPVYASDRLDTAAIPNGIHWIMLAQGQLIRSDNSFRLDDLTQQ